MLQPQSVLVAVGAPVTVCTVRVNSNCTMGRQHNWTLLSLDLIYRNSYTGIIRMIKN
jgi:hypothetical protein